MYEDKTHALFTKYAIPQMIELLFNSIYLIVDGIFIGNRLGREAMAAAAVSVPFIEVLIALSMAVASGAGILISSQLGRKEKEKAIQTFNTAILCSLIIGIFVIVFGNNFLHPLARLLGSTPQIHNEATRYLWYIVTFSPFLLFSFLLGGLARNDGRPKLAMFALATALGPIFSVLILLPHFLMKKGNLYFAKLKIRIHNIRRIFTLGFPSFIMEFTIGIVTFVYNFAIVRHGYGEIGLAAYLVIGYLMLIVLTIFLGMAEGLQPVFSHFTGTGEVNRNRDLRRFASKAFLIIGILCYLLIVFFSRYFYSIFIPGDMDLISFMTGKSAPYFCGFFLAGYNILMISYWQSTHSTKKALLISLSRSIVCPPILIVVLPLIFGSEVLWLCHSLSEGLTACIAFGLLLMARRNTYIENETVL